MLKNLQLHLTKILLTKAFLLMGVISWGQYSGSGTFTKITSLAELTDGYYVIAYGTSQAMNNNHNGTYFNKTSISPSGGTVITNPSAAIVWKIETNGSGRTIYNENSSKYVSYSGSSNNVKVVDAVSGNNQRWNFSYSSSLFVISNAAVTNRILQYNLSNPRFACYTTNQKKLTLYKMEPSGPSVTTEAVSDVDTDLAILNGSITNGDATAVSFEYGTSVSYGTTVAGDPAAITGDDSFSAIVALNVNTQYHYRAIITGGSEVGDDVAFWTLAAQPTAPTASNIDITTVDIAIGAGDGNPSTTQYAIYEFYTDTYVQSDGTLGAAEAWHTAAEWTAITVNGLTSETDYAFYTKARNGENVETTESLDAAEITTLADTSPNITADPLTAFGNVCINTTTTENSFSILGVNLTSDDVVVTAPTGYTLSTTASGTYTTALTYTPVDGELLEDIYVRFTPTLVASYDGSITITGGGLASSVTVAASGSGIDTVATISTSSAFDVATDSATLGGNVTAEGCNTVTARGVVIGTSANPTIGGTGVTNYTAVSGGSGTYTVSATGLTSNTQYYARAYATSTSGTAYGSDVTFTTLCGDFSLPFSEDFEDSTFAPNCWSTFRGTNGLGTSQDWKRTTSGTYNSSAGTAFVRYENVSDGFAAQDWLVTPGIVLPNTDGTIELSYYERNDYDDGTQYYIKIATSNPSDPDSYTTVVNYDESDVSDSSYTERTVDLTAYEGQTVYVAFVMEQDNGDSWYVDDISISEVAPPLSAPVALTATNITTSSFTAAWSAVDDATSYRLDVYTQTEGTDFTDLIISEYVEGETPGNNRAIELYNGTGSSVDLSEYSISRGNDTKYVLSGTLANGETYVIASSEAAAATIAAADLTLSYSAANTAVYFTGDEDVNLYKNFVLIDKVGAGNTDVTLRRKSTVMDPSTSYSSSEWDSYPVDNVDDLGSHTSVGGTTTTYVSGYEDLNVGNVTSYDVTDLDADTDYHYVVRAVSASETSADSNIIDVTTGIENVWNGSAWSAGYTPTEIDEAIIEGAYNTADEGTFSAGALTINTGGSIVIASGDNLTVIGAVVNNEEASAFIVENNANLIQIDDVANTGNIQVEKDSSPLYRLDYSLWSSPVAGQNLLAFSPQTLTNRFYDYDESTDLYTSIVPGSNDFQPGYGYLIRMPNNHVSFVEESTPGEAWTGTFEGQPNNGTITIPMETAFNGYNLVGNPYPSPINIAAFYAANAGTLEVGSALYFWRKRNNPDATTYCTITNAAYTANSAAGGDTGSWFNGVNSSSWVINPGQGFFVKAIGSSLVFNNAMRAEINNGQFFRTTEDAQQQSSRLWLNLTAEGKFSQMAIVYNTNMTLGIDYGWDGKALVADGPVTIYTMAQEENLAIQARPEFTEEDQVPVGFYAAAPGNYTISLDHVDGLFAEGQEIYINDNLLNITHNLTSGDYNFSTQAGTFNDRFEVIYTIQGTLDTNNPVLTSNEVVTYKDGNSIVIDAGTAEIGSVNIYDINGRLLYNANDVNTTTTAVNSLRIEQQVIILEINTDRGTVSKKVVY